MIHTPPHIGQAMPRREDLRLITGQGQFADDVALQDPLYLGFARSQVACGVIDSLDTDGAFDVPGVHAVHVGGEVAHLGNLSVNQVLPLTQALEFPVLVARDINSLGQPLAAVLADTRQAAQLGAEAIYADVAEQDFIPQTIAEQSWQDGDCEAAFAQAAHVVRVRLKHPRLAPNPMETRAISVSYDDRAEAVTVWHSTQTPHRARDEIAAIIGVDPARIRVIARDVGGAFGMKGSIYPEEAFAVWAAFHHRRDVKWIASRSEDFLSATQGRGVESEGELAVDAQGNFLGLRARVTAPIGPWLPNSALITGWNAARVLPCGYRVQALDVATQLRTCPLGPMGIYRGAGRPEANVLMERLVDEAARALGRDPVELRQQNLLPSSALPHRSATGNLLDSGDYAGALDQLCQMVGYAEMVTDRDRRRAAGEIVGLGVACYVEPSGSGWESACVTLNADGTAQVVSGAAAQGHGRETALAQIAADGLGIAPDAVEVVVGDTGRIATGIGALASRATAIGGSAVLTACAQILQRRNAGQALPITVDLTYENQGQAWGNGAALALVAIDADTGVMSVEQVALVDDTGRIVNPAQVAGQIRGGLAQGLGEALMEAVIHDEDGQLLTGSFMDYTMPRAADMPPLTLGKMESPSPLNALGAKGVGEAGTIIAPAVVLNAAVDALRPMGVTDLQMPLTAHRLWQAMMRAKETTL